MPSSDPRTDALWTRSCSRRARAATWKTRSRSPSIAPRWCARQTMARLCRPRRNDDGRHHERGGRRAHRSAAASRT